MFRRYFHRLGAFAYRLAFFIAAGHLFWRGATDADARVALVSLGLGALCLLRFLVLVLGDVRRGRPPPPA